MNSKLKPALIGGVITGLLSAIPFVNIPNLCCCLWAIVGGLVASFMYIRSSSIPAKTGDGAVLGALAGLIGAAIYVVLGIPLGIAFGGVMNGIIFRLMESANPAQAEQMRQQIEAGQSIVSAILFGLFWAVLLVVFSVVGGLIAVPIFEKRKGHAVPPPPPAPGPPGGYGTGL